MPSSASNDHVESLSRQLNEANQTIIELTKRLAKYEPGILNRSEPEFPILSVECAFSFFCWDFAHFIV